ncbi:MAG: hypothetical protein HDR25_06895 [Lachnospiraceae bacterium]|nr:hypothetical protein [Lachnospiraceae bacterium]
MWKSKRACHFIIIKNKWKQYFKRRQTGMNDNDFDFQRIAQGYKDRPFLHKQVIERFQRDIT